MLEEKFGTILPHSECKIHLRDENFVAPTFDYRDESEGKLQELGWQRGRKWKVPAKEMAETPPENFSQFKDSVLLHPPTGKTPKAYRTIFVDTSKRYQDEERPIMVEEYDGSVRSADWTERRYVMTLFRSPRQKITKNWKGGLKTETRKDLDKFYVDEEELGLPDFLPNNQRPRASHYDEVMSRLRAVNLWGDVEWSKGARKRKAKAAAEAAAAPPPATADDAPASTTAAESKV